MTTWQRFGSISAIQDTKVKSNVRLSKAQILVGSGILLFSFILFLFEPRPEHYVPFPQNQALATELDSLHQSEGVLAFPGALGFGKHSTGGRGGRVVVVNTVEDIVDPTDNQTSLREAIEIETDPRTIVFSVGGIFDTSNQDLILSSDSGSNVTVACQTAPSPGVVIRTFGFNIQNGASNIIFRHCAVRLVDVGAPDSVAGRTFTIRAGSENIILDHMSLSWATDEGFQAYLGPDETVGINNITVSNSIVSEGDADSSHPLSIERPDLLYHAMGPSCNNNNKNGHKITNCSIVNNYIAHNASRNAMIWGGTGELKNNVIYNWRGIGLTVQPHVGGGVDVIIDNNLMKSGPDTVSASKTDNCGPERYKCAMYLGASNKLGVSRFSIGSNFYTPGKGFFRRTIPIDHTNANSPDGVPSFKAATDSPIKVTELASKGSRFMTCVGASRPVRDAIDSRVIQEFYDRNGRIGIGDNIRTGGQNVNIQRTWDLYGPATQHPVNYDTDQDGMPDSWEIENQLSPNDPDDHSGDLDKDGYTNLEEYLAIAAHC